jgi:hypothetical protein
MNEICVERVFDIILIRAGHQAPFLTRWIQPTPSIILYHTRHTEFLSHRSCYQYELVGRVMSWVSLPSTNKLNTDGGVSQTGF